MKNVLEILLITCLYFSQILIVSCNEQQNRILQEQTQVQASNVSQQQEPEFLESNGEPTFVVEEYKKQEQLQENKDEPHRQINLIEVEDRIELNTPVQRRHEKSDTIIYYHFKIDKLVNSQSYGLQDFIIVTEPLNKESDPDIYISKDIEKPNPTVLHINMTICSTYGIDLCPFTRDSFNVGDTVNVGIYCEKECQYILEVRYTDERKLELNQQTLTYLREQEIQIFRIDIPNNEAIERLQIWAHPTNTKDINSTFNLRVETPFGHAILHEGWSDGKVAHLKRGDTHFCSGCSIKLIIESQQAAVFKLGTWADSKIVQLGFYTRRFDSIGEGETNTYLLNISRFASQFSKKILENEDIHFEILTFAGKIQVYANPTQPASDETALYSYSEVGSFDIIFKQYHRDNSSLIYLTVQGKFSSTFEIYPYLTSKNEKNIRLNTIEEGIMDINEIMNFKFQIQGQSSSYFQIVLQTAQGYADLYVKKCKKVKRHNCVITKKEIKENVKGNGPDFYVVNGQSHIETLRLYHSIQDCGNMRGNHPFLISDCSYAIAIKSKSSLSHTLQYRLTIKEQKQTQNIIEGNVQRNHIEKGEVSYFKYIPAPYDTQINSVKFHFTAISGFGDVIVSRLNKFPNEQNFEKKAIGGQEDIIFTQSDVKILNQNIYSLTSPYYIAISAPIETCSYQFSVSVTRNVSQFSKDDKFTQGNIHIAPLELIEGQATTHTLSDGEDNAIFFFDLDLQSDYHGQFRINVIPILGQFRFYVNNDDSIPSVESHQFEAPVHQHHLTIRTSDRNFTRGGRYYILVQNLNKEKSKGKFMIYYSFASTIVTLIEGVQHRTVIHPNEDQFYRIHVSPNNNQIVISKSATTDYVDLYISTHSTNTRPTSSNNDYFDYFKKESSVKIKYYNISENCPQLSHKIIYQEQYIQTRDCYFYVTVHNPHKHPITYGIQQHKINQVNQLYDGISHSYQYPEKGEQLRFIYQVSNKQQPIMINVQSHYGKLELYAKITDSSKDTLSVTQREKYFLDDQSSDAYSKDLHFSNLQSVVLKTEQLEHCGRTCSIIIGVSGDALDSSVLTDYIKQQVDQVIQGDSFSIIVTSSIHHLLEGRPVKGYVQENSIVYYMFELNRPTAEILITLTPIGSGDPDLVVDIGNEARPTATQYRWASESFKSEHLTIQSQDFRVGESMEGKYVIGVIGYTNSSFLLTVLFQETKKSEILDGINYEFTIKPGQILYLDYFHRADASFEIDLIREVGDAIVIVNSYTFNEDYAQHLPTLNNHTWSADLGNVRQDKITITMPHQEFCFYCWYLIGIQARNQQSKVSINVKSEQSYKHLQNGKAYMITLKPQETQKFVYELTHPDYIELNIHILYGQPDFLIENTYYHDKTEVYKSTYQINKTYQQNYYGLQKIFKVNIPVEDTKMHLLCKHPDKLTESNYRNCRVFSSYRIYANSSIPTMFTLLVKTRESQAILTDGIYHTDTLEGKQTQYYVIYGLDNPSSNHTFNLLIQRSPLMTQTNELPEVIIEFEEFIKRQDDITNAQKPRRLPKIVNNFYEKIEGFISYRIISERGRYYIRLTNPFGGLYDYSILMSSQDISILPIDQPHYGVSQENLLNYYQIIVNRPGVLHFTIDKCVGTVEPYISKTLKNITQIDTSGSIEDYNSYYIYDPDTEQQQVYFSVNQSGQQIYAAIEFQNGPLINGHKEAFYKLLAQIRLPSDSTEDSHILTPGNGGHFDYSLANIQDRAYQFSFSPVEIQGTIQNNTENLINIHNTTSTLQNHLHNYDIKYTLYLTNNLVYLNLITRCGAILNSSNLAPSELQNKSIWHQTYSVSCNYTQSVCSGEVILKSHEDKGKIFATVKATVINFNQGFQNTLNYHTVEFYVVPEYLQTGFLTALGATVIIILCLIIFVLAKKYNKTKKILNVEMQDIRNIASLNLDEGRNAAQNIIEKVKYGEMSEENI